MAILDAISSNITESGQVSATLSGTDSTAASLLSLPGISGGFSEFVSALQTSLSGADSENESNNQTALTSMQSGLIGALGLPVDGALTLESLTSDSGLSALQNTLLTSLQKDLFSAATSASSTETETDQALTSDEETAQSSALDKMFAYSFGEDGLSLKDGFDAVNLLNHIPMVGDVYQQVSDSHIDAAANLAGGFLYGGPMGLAYSAMSLSVEGMTGKSISANLWDYGEQLLAQDESTQTAEVSPETNLQQQLSSGAYQFVRREFSAD